MEVPKGWTLTLEGLIEGWSADAAELRRLVPMTSGRTAALLHVRANALDRAREAVEAALPLAPGDVPYKLAPLLRAGALVSREEELSCPIDKLMLAIQAAGADEEIRWALERALILRSVSLR